MGTGGRRGFTLLEVMVAMGLVGVVGLSFAHLYVNSQRYLTQSILVSETQGEASFAMEHIKRQLLNAVALAVPPEGAPPPQTTTLNFTVQRRIVIPPENINAQYQLNGTTLMYFEAGGGFIPIARNITAITFTRNSRTQLGVVIIARRQTAPGGDVGQTRLEAVINLRGML